MKVDPARPAPLQTRDGGTGPPILLLHGLGGDHTVFNGILPGLSTELRVLAPDLRGHGRSSAPPSSQFTFDELEGDLWALLDEAELPKVHLVGLSAGGFLALRMALDRPERLSSLTTIAAGSHCDRHTRAIGERWAETFRSEGFDGYLLRLLKDLYYPDWIEAHMEYVDDLRARLRPGNMDGTARWGLAVRGFDERARIPKLKLPTLVIHGMDDQVVDVSHARLLRQSIPGAELRLLARTGHMVPVERPSETEDAIRTWIRKIEGGLSSGTSTSETGH